jgi:hypothetical protein
MASVEGRLNMLLQGKTAANNLGCRIVFHVLFILWLRPWNLLCSEQLTNTREALAWGALARGIDSIGNAAKRLVRTWLLSLEGPCRVVTLMNIVQHVMRGSYSFRENASEMILLVRNIQSCVANDLAWILEVLKLLGAVLLSLWMIRIRCRSSWVLTTVKSLCKQCIASNHVRWRRQSSIVSTQDRILVILRTVMARRRCLRHWLMLFVNVNLIEEGTCLLAQNWQACLTITWWHQIPNLFVRKELTQYLVSDLLDVETNGVGLATRSKLCLHRIIARR